ncbi:MAG: heavy metal translocating P-type ATPase [Chloroflexota bacterium]
MLIQRLTASGVLSSGVSIYKTKKNKKSPLILKAKQLAKNKKGGNVLVSVLSQKSSHQGKKQSFTLLTKVRKRLFSDDPIEFESGYEEKELKRNLGVAFTALVLTSIGALLYWPLTFVGVGLLICLEADWTVRDGYRFLFIEKRVGAFLSDLMTFYGPLLTGNYFALSVGKSLYYSNRTMLWYTEDHSTKSLVNVFGEQPRSIWILSEGVEIEIPFEQLKIGDIVVMSAGETIAIDGTIQDGIATIDQRALTGESQPAEKGEGEEVFASTLVISGRICVLVEKTGQETVAAQIGHILNHTLDFKKTVQFRGEAVIDKWVWPNLALSALTAPFLGFAGAVAVSFAAFGYHMRISAPISILNFLRITSDNGILVKDGRSLEQLAQVDTIVFDKTGTLTEEVPHVGQIYSCPGYDELLVLKYAAAAEHKQTHPIAQAILFEANNRQVALPSVSDVTVSIGYGLTVFLDGKEIRVGSTRFMEMSAVRIPTSISDHEAACHKNGHSLVYVAVCGQLAGAIELRPTIRAEAKEIIDSLRQRNLGMFIISGDHETPTQTLANELGIDNYFAEVLPEDKADLIARLQRKGKNVCFVGDGINDSIALKSANVSVSLRGASTIATDTASIILMDGTLNQLSELFQYASELESNLNTCYRGTIVPGLICIAGVWFFHLGVVGAMMLYYSGLFFGVSSAMYPLLKHQKSYNLQKGFFSS